MAVRNNPAAAPHAHVHVIGEESFEQEVLRSELPVLVEFTIPKSPQSKKVAPEVEALAQDLEGKAKVIRVDVERSKRIAASLRIQSVPTFMVFVRGRPVAGEAGIVNRHQLREMLEQFLPRAEGAIRAVELAQLLQQRQVVAVDTRDASSYGRARIPGATHLPFDEIEGRLAELHMLAGEPILYCRAGDKTKELAAKLAESGIPVGFLEGGFLAWEGEGLPIERPD